MFSSVVFRLSKMKLFLVFLSLLFCLLIDESHQEMCINSSGLNEVFSQCEGAGLCQKTCYNRNAKEAPICSCTPGFICKKGYIRCPNTYRCILEKYCGASNRCPSNEVYSTCKAGCENTCNSLDAEMKCPCKAGCICAEGYARCDVSNKCIKKESCSGNIISLLKMFDVYNKI